MANIWEMYVYPVLNTQAAATSVAIVAVLTVFIIYVVRRRDNKRDAANIVLLEIKNAERKLAEARKSYEEGRANNPSMISFPEKLRLMKTESWTKYKYLFVRDLEPEQWDGITTFYENCRNFDEAVEHKDSAFGLNEDEIRANIQRNIATYAKELADNIQANPENEPSVAKENSALEADIKARSAQAFQAYLGSLIQIYNPDKSFKDAAYYFNLLPESIINTPTGIVLKKLAGVTRHRYFR